MNVFLTSQASNVLKKILALLPRQSSEYKVVFVPTAAKPYADAPWMYTDRDELLRLGFVVENLELDTASVDEVKKAVEVADIIFVAGGNTFYLLEQAKKTGFIEIVREGVTKGKIYVGSSAGSVLAAPDIKYVELFDDPAKANLENTKSLGLVGFAILPHLGNPKYKELHDRVLNEYKDWPYPLVPVSDDQFAVPEGGGWEIK
jgi:dipeptidase E